jgi:integrase/recombinase XerD
MTTTSTTPTTEIAVLDPQFSDAERYALGAFLAGYRGQTRDAYAVDLRRFVAWCEQHDLKLFAVRRADIECFARDLEERGRATAARRLSTVAGFYRYADEEGLLSPSPAAHVRRPGSTTSPTPPASTATRSERCSSRPGSRQRETTR